MRFDIRQSNAHFWREMEQASSDLESAACAEPAGSIRAVSTHSGSYPHDLK
jgi:hypothetical protein